VPLLKPRVSWLDKGQTGVKVAMPTINDMQTSLEDARFFHAEIETIVRGPQVGHDLTRIRRYFRAYLHCWKTVVHLVRSAKGLDRDKKGWISWCKRWQTSLTSAQTEVFEQLRQTRDYDTHQGMIVVDGEVAAGLFPIVMLIPTRSTHSRRELISCTSAGLDLADRLIRDHPTV
jgi:hypothetical protein